MKLTSCSSRYFDKQISPIPLTAAGQVFAFVAVALEPILNLSVCPSIFLRPSISLLLLLRSYKIFSVSQVVMKLTRAKIEAETKESKEAVDLKKSPKKSVGAES